jgi:hypothetical protein
MTTAKAQAAQLLFAREATPGTAPSTGWLTTQPNPSGIQNFHANYTDVQRNPLSPYMTKEKGAHVGLSAEPSLVHDMSKGLFDTFGAALLRSLAKVPGNKGVQFYYPTAVTATDYTVAASGDLTAKLLVFARGFVNTANNGVKLVGAASTGIAIKATGLVAETVATAGSAMVEVCGIEAAAAADVQINAAGNLISTTTDFTVLNLKIGHKVFWRWGTGTNEFGIITPPIGPDGKSMVYGYATVAAVPTTNLITLKWHSFTPAADVATGKTIRLYVGVMYANYADGDANYIEEPSFTAELRDSGVGTANGAVYSYGYGLVVDKFTFSMPVEAKIEATLAFKGRSIAPPVDVGSRIAGPSAAYPALGMELFNTTRSMIMHRVVDASNSAMIASVNSATLTIDHGFEARKQHAVFGAYSMIGGDIVPMVEMDTFFESKAVPIAIDADTECRYECAVKNGQGGVSFDLPTILLRNGAKTYGENKPVMMAVGVQAHRDPNTNVVCLVNVLPYLP